GRDAGELRGAETRQTLGPRHGHVAVELLDRAGGVTQSGHLADHVHPLDLLLLGGPGDQPRRPGQAPVIPAPIHPLRGDAQPSEGWGAAGVAGAGTTLPATARAGGRDWGSGLTRVLHGATDEPGATWPLHSSPSNEKGREPPSRKSLWSPCAGTCR